MPTGIASDAKLMAQPRSLGELWHEFQFGYGRNKPAKDFTREERNNKTENIKQKYYRRKKIWRLQCYLMNFAPNMKIEEVNRQITRVYRTGIPTRLVDAIGKDERNPANPQVQGYGKAFRINPQLHASAIQ